MELQHGYAEDSNITKISINGLDIFSLRSILNMEVNEFSELIGIKPHWIEIQESCGMDFNIENKCAHIIYILVCVCKLLESDEKISSFSAILREKLEEKGRNSAIQYLLMMPKVTGVVWNRG